jgi:hypothetical protein
MVIFIFFIALRIISDTYLKKNTFVENTQIRIEDSIIQNMTMGQLVEAGLKFPEYSVKVPQDGNYRICLNYEDINKTLNQFCYKYHKSGPIAPGWDYVYFGINRLE